jgi:hypothetical protein
MVGSEPGNQKIKICHDFGYLWSAQILMIYQMVWNGRSFVPSIFSSCTMVAGSVMKKVKVTSVMMIHLKIDTIASTDGFLFRFNINHYSSVQ